MTASIAILVSGASGAVVTLVGVVTGGVIASRSQRRQWLRDKQVDACAVVVVGEREQVSDVPVARPPLAEIRQMFGLAAESDSKGAANLHGADDG
jgi:hypothetical protein